MKQSPIKFELSIGLNMGIFVRSLVFMFFGISCTQSLREYRFQIQGNLESATVMSVSTARSRLRCLMECSVSDTCQAVRFLSGMVENNCLFLDPNTPAVNGSSGPSYAKIIPPVDVVTTTELAAAPSTDQITTTPPCIPAPMLSPGTLASSAYSASSVYLRLFQTTTDFPPEDSYIGHSNAWCSQNNSPMEGEWIEADLGSVMSVTHIATKGLRFVALFNKVQYYNVDLYKLKYKESTTWETYQDPPGTEKVFAGNVATDVEAVVEHQLVTPVTARYVRLYVVHYEIAGSGATTTVCMRWDFKTCPV